MVEEALYDGLKGIKSKARIKTSCGAIVEGRAIEDALSVHGQRMQREKRMKEFEVKEA